MKTVINISFLLSLLMLFISTECTHECEAFTGEPDLSFICLEQSQMEEGENISYSVVYEVIPYEGYFCKNLVTPVNPHKDQLTLLYSSNASFETNGRIIQTKIAEIEETISVDEKYKLESILQFEVNGYYEVIGEIDVNEEVYESDETNNKSDLLTYKLSSAKIRAIIHVNHTGNTNPVRNDENDNPVYVTSWNLNILK